MVLPDLIQPNTKNTEVRAIPIGPQSLKPKRVLEPVAERISKDNQKGRWLNTQSFAQCNAGRKKNSVSSGNDDRERGKRGCSWKRMTAAGHKSVCLTEQLHISP